MRSSHRPVGRLAAVVFPLLLVLAACAGGGSGEPADGETGGETGSGTATVSNGTVEVTADDLEFNVSTIEANAGEAFTVVFTNLETQPHNVAIYTEENGEAVVVGEIITGPDATDEIEVPALEAGTYYFRCDVHPDMEGSVVVS